MTTYKRSIGLVAAIALVAGTITGCQSMGEHRTRSGALGGAAVGGIAGALIDDSNPWRGALIGSAAGAAVGAGIGKVLQRQKEAFDRIERLEAQPQQVIIQEQNSRTGETRESEKQALMVRAPADVLFAVDSAELTPNGRNKVREMAQVLTEFPDSTVYVRGYTSSEGDLDYNYRLSERRANAVRDELVTNGVDPNRLFTQGMGPTNPVATNDTEFGRTQNRRVELHIVPHDQGQQ